MADRFWTIGWFLACLAIGGPAAVWGRGVESVQLDTADTAAMAQLQRFEAYLDDEQWDEAIETLRGAMEESGGKLVKVADRRYVSLRQYAHLQLAAMPGEALQLYRRRVDPVAKTWYEQAIAGRDRKLLDQIVREAFVSSWGDDALLALGEMALESGDFASARWYWERILPVTIAADSPRTWPGYPDTTLELAAVRARLVLTSILEGAADRAGDELAQFERLHPDARGHLAGEEVDYAEKLGSLLRESAAWRREKPGVDWPTFAGSPTRNRIAPKLIDIGAIAWRVPLIEGPVSDLATLPARFHPITVDNRVLVHDRRRIMAIDAVTGKPAWGEADGLIYRSELPQRIDPADTRGISHCTLTERQGLLLAWMGSHLTSRPQDDLRGWQPGPIVAIDLATEGRLIWKIEPDDGWTFDGCPLVDDDGVYVATRRLGVRREAHVECFEVRTGRRRWRQFVCGSDTTAGGSPYERTHNLLSLRGDTLYFNTNLGAVASLSKHDGRLEWVSLYPRADSRATSNRRELTPCLLDGQRLLVAPADSPRIFAMDTGTGQILWQTGSQVEDVLHLLGTTDEHLIASGRRLYWIGLDGEAAGKIQHVWPQSHEPTGYGRGILAGSSILWPTLNKLYIFDSDRPEPRRVVSLLSLGLTGGNLLIAGGHLLVAGETELVAIAPYGKHHQRKPSLSALQPRK